VLAQRRGASSRSSRTGSAGADLAEDAAPGIVRAQPRQGAAGERGVGAGVVLSCAAHAVVDHYRAAARANARSRRWLPARRRGEPDLDSGTASAAAWRGCRRPQARYALALRRIDVDGLSVRTTPRGGISPTMPGVRVFRAREALRKRVVRWCGSCAERGCIDCTCGEPGSAAAAPERARKLSAQRQGGRFASLSPVFEVLLRRLATAAAPQRQALLHAQPPRRGSAPPSRSRIHRTSSRTGHSFWIWFADRSLLGVARRLAPSSPENADPPTHYSWSAAAEPAHHCPDRAARVGAGRVRAAGSPTVRIVGSMSFGQTPRRRTPSCHGTPPRPVAAARRVVRLPGVQALDLSVRSSCSPGRRASSRGGAGASGYTVTWSAPVRSRSRFVRVPVPRGRHLPFARGGSIRSSSSVAARRCAAGRGGRLAGLRQMRTCAAHRIGLHGAFLLAEAGLLDGRAANHAWSRAPS